MGRLICKRCGANAEADSFKEADGAIDHARGKMIGRPCEGNDKDLVWIGQTGTVEKPREKESTKEAEPVISKSLIKKAKKKPKGK